MKMVSLLRRSVFQVITYENFMNRFIADLKLKKDQNYKGFKVKSNTIENFEHICYVVLYELQVVNYELRVAILRK